jgi:hypothetical protein
MYLLASRRLEYCRAALPFHTDTDKLRKWLQNQNIEQTCPDCVENP